MARFRNHTGYPLVIADLRRTVGPSGEFDWPGYDQARHGVVTGCTRLDEPAPAAPTSPPPAAPAPPAAGSPSPVPAAAIPDKTPAAAPAAGKEN